MGKLRPRKGCDLLKVTPSEVGAGLSEEQPELFGSCSCASRSLSWLTPDPRQGRCWSRSSPSLGMKSDSAITTGVMSGKSIHLSEPFPHFK